MSEEWKAWVGRRLDPAVAADPVDLYSIRHFCELVGDASPLYWDEAYAKKTRWGGTIAPPASLLVWGMPHSFAPRPEGAPQVFQTIMAIPLDAPAVIVQRCEQEFLRPLRPGDRVTTRATVKDIVGPKATRLGEGFFITLEFAYANQEGDPVGLARFIALRYRPGADPSGASSRGSSEERAVSASPASGGSTVGSAAVARSGPPTFASVQIGESIPALSTEVTVTLCVLNASAARDYYPVHHDRDFARAAGAPDIFVNTTFYSGFLGRLAGEWAGPEGELRALDFTMRDMNRIGDTMRGAGRVEAKLPDSLVDCSLWIENARGVSTPARASVRLAGK